MTKHLPVGPDFLCVGAQKAGTQWLYDQLQHHADFWMPPIKELHYFDGRPVKGRRAQVLYERASADLPGTNRDRAAKLDRALAARDLEFLAAFVRLSEAHRPALSARVLLRVSALASRFAPVYSSVHREVVWPALGVGRRPDFEGYARLFAAKGHALSGDITPGYSTLPTRTVRQIVAAFPGLRVVFLARDPVERFWSAVSMHVRHGRAAWPGDARALERLLGQVRHAHRSYQTRIVARWRRFVPHGQFGLFLFDDLLADAAHFRHRVLTFLGGDPRKPSGDLPAGFNRKERGSRRPLPPEFRETLGRLLADELRESAREFGGAARTWPARYGL